jgi:hypothetical protein
MAEDFKSGALAYLKKHNKGPSWSIYFTTDLLIVCGFAASRTIILSQLLWLQDHSTRKDGYFYKSHKELTEETGASKSSIIRAIGWFEERGFLKVKIKKAKGYPTSHYRIDQGAFLRFGRAKILEYNSKK